MGSNTSVFLVGAGPGDPELLTLRALRLLETADVILFDRLVSPEILAMARPEAEFVYTGKEEGHADEIQDETIRLMIAYAGRGRRIVRLKGGDPFVFGRGGEEMLALRERGISVEIVPGVSSAIAAPAAAGIPVTCRGVASTMAICTARCQGGDLAEWTRVAGVDTLVILMSVKYRHRVAQSLIEAGRSADEPAAFVERGTLPGQRVIETTLGEIAAERVAVEAPAVLVVGHVVALRERGSIELLPEAELLLEVAA